MDARMGVRLIVRVSVDVRVIMVVRAGIVCRNEGKGGELASILIIII